MKFAKYLDDTLVPEWKHAYVNYKYLKKNTLINQQLFLSNLDDELKKVYKFYFDQIKDFDAKYTYINKQYQDYLSEVKNNTIKKKLKYLSREFYQLCEFLQNFQKLNKIAFLKIIKKYDKKNETCLMNQILEHYTEHDVFTDKTPEIYLNKIVDLTSFHLFDNERKPTLVFLRGNDKAVQDEFTFFRVGLYFGLSIPLIILSIIKIISDNLITGIWYPILYIYGGIFSIILSLFCFGIDVYIWRKYRINYIFILELDVRSALSYRQFFTFSSISLLLWSLFLFLTVHNYLGNVLNLKYLPLILICIGIFLLFLPFKIFYFKTRKWFLKTILHIFTPGFRQIVFKDFFIADILISLSFFWSSLYVLICFYFNSTDNQCTPVKSYITPFLLSIPLFIRAIQCIKKCYDHETQSQKNKQLFNSLKYILAISSVFLSSFNAITKYLSITIIWIIFALISTAYSYYWDLIYDWNIKCNHKLIPKKWLKSAIFINFILRCNWILSINTFLLFDQVFLSFIFSCFEIFRRYIWAIFRLETEHTRNVEQYRAINDIPVLNNI